MTVHPLDLLKPKSNERYFNNRGQLNASSRNEAFSVIRDLMDRASRGEIQLGNSEDENFDKAAAESKRKEDNAKLVNAYHAGINSKAWMDLGAAIAATVYSNMERSALARRFLVPVESGNPTRVQVKQRGNVPAFVASDTSAIAPHYVNESGMIEIPEVNIITNPRVLLSAIRRGSPTLLEDTYDDALYGISLAEDKLYALALRRTAAYNGYTRVLGSIFSMGVLAMMRQEIEGDGLPVGSLIVGSSIWPDIFDPNFAPNLNPITDFERISTGRFANLGGVDIVTDGYRPGNMRVFDPREIFLVAAPEYHGNYIDEEVRVSPENNFRDGQLAQGWAMFEYFGLAITNPQSVSMALKG